MKKSLVTILKVAAVFVFLMLSNAELEAQTVVKNPQKNMTVTQLVTLKDNYEQYYNTQLSKRDLMSKLEPTQVNYGEWQLVKNYFSQDESASEEDVQLLEKLVERLSASL